MTGDLLDYRIFKYELYYDNILLITKINRVLIYNFDFFETFIVNKYNIEYLTISIIYTQISSDIIVSLDLCYIDEIIGSSLIKQT